MVVVEDDHHLRSLIDVVLRRLRPSRGRLGEEHRLCRRCRAGTRRCRTCPTDQRHGWWWIGAALAARAVGFSLHAFYVRDLDPQPYPSVRTFWSFRLVQTVAQLTVQLEVERSEIRTLQLQRMESLGRLAGGVAHDFNNLLTVIVNYANMSRAALEPVDDQVDDPWVEVREDLANVALAGERAAELTHQLLRFARRDIAKPEVIDVNTLITETAQLVRRSISEDIEFETLLDPELPSVVIDPGQFEQVVLNLALNARDALPDGGSMTIETRASRPFTAYAPCIPAVGRSTCPGMPGTGHRDVPLSIRTSRCSKSRSSAITCHDHRTDKGGTSNPDRAN